MTYPDVANPDLLRRIPLGAKRVVDIGCATGALGAEFKRRNPRAHYIGVEQDINAAQIAATRVDEIIVGNIEERPSPLTDRISTESVDCLIYGDVLEHLADPWEILRSHIPLLAPDGIVLICMPNIGHWSFIERLLQGTWDYEPLGLLDRTHLRWFTHPATERMLRDVGLQPIDAFPRVFNPEAAESFTQTLGPALRRLGVNADDFQERTAPLQFVWRAALRTVTPLPLVSTMLAPVGGVSHVRVTEPIQALASVPTLLPRVVMQGEGEVDDDEPAGIFIFHRPLLAGTDGIARIRSLLSKGWLIVCEFDDHPDYIPVLQRPDILNFRGVHAVQTTTPLLAEVLRRDNPEIRVFPNGIARLPDPVNYREFGRLTMLFAGLNRENEWPGYLEALNRAFGKARDRLQIVIVADRGLFERLETPNKTFVPLCDYDRYQALLAASEISFMPLQDTPFNRCKSDLKFIEAAARRVTPLASALVYEQTAEDGRTAALFRTPDELESQLLNLVANPQAAKAIGDAARTYVARKRMLAYQIADRAAWYHDLWARREELHRALLARLPELAA